MKKRIPFFLILSLCLSGCGLLGIPKAYEEGTGETLPKFRMEEKTFHYPETVTVSYPDGTSACTEYLYKDAVGADRLVYKHCTGLIYYENDQEISREDWEPDAQGNPVTTTAHPDGTPTAFTYRYDEENRMTQKTCSVNGQPDYIVEYTYDKNGLLLSEEFLGSFTQLTEYTYDANDRVTEKRITTDGVLTDRTETAYDAGGAIRAVFHYDGKGDLICREEYSTDGSYETVYVYDSSDKLLYRWEHTYSAFGLLARKIVYGPEDSLISTTLYTYTSVKNSYLVEE